MSEIKQVLMKRDGYSASRAEAKIKEARRVLNGYLAKGKYVEAESICEEFFGLEEDYIYELL